MLSLNCVLSMGDARRGLEEVSAVGGTSGHHRVADLDVSLEFIFVVAVQLL